MMTPRPPLPTAESTEPQDGQEFGHSTVLLHEAVQALVPFKADGIYVDGTYGRGGHSRLMLSQLPAGARLIAFDKDLQAIANARQIADSRFTIIHNSFATLQSELAARAIDQVDGVLLDLGISSPQVDDATRGFSFRADGPLDMRMDTTRGMSAAHWLASATEQHSEEVIRNYGEERFAFSDCKGDCSSPTVSNNFKHTRACLTRGWCRQNA